MAGGPFSRGDAWHPHGELIGITYYASRITHHLSSSAYSSYTPVLVNPSFV
jgi:hypothetical protein